MKLNCQTRIKNRLNMHVNVNRENIQTNNNMGQSGCGDKCLDLALGYR